MAKTIASSLAGYGAADYQPDERVIRDEDQTHAETGAVLGGFLGATAGLVASVTGFAVSAGDPIAAASPMVMALTGAAVGAMAGGLIGALTEDIDQRVSRWRDGGRTAWRTFALHAPEEAERERRQYGAHADPLTGLPLTADPELDNALETTIRR